MTEATHQSDQSAPSRALAYLEDKLAEADSFIDRNVAVIIGINDYASDAIPSLQTARPDAERLAEILQGKPHEYRLSFDGDRVSTLLVDGQATKKDIEKLLAHLSNLVTETDRLLFYFAGHGLALRGEDGPQGYLIPQDATEDSDSYLPMQELHDTLTELRCHHCLIILDCCFSGSFRWSSTRAWSPPPRTLYVEDYLRFIRYPAWQVLTSTSYDQEALDSLVGAGFGVREESGQAHSPFAQALFTVLQGEDEEADANDDGILMATELQIFLRNKVEVKIEQQTQRKQTPQLWGLRNHDKGEYIFLLGERSLEPAPEPSPELNPYRGLEPYNEEHADKFFGRGRLIELLTETVAEHPVTLVLGASGTGKSSLVKAGLLPYLQRLDAEAQTQTWTIWRMPAEDNQQPQPLRPTAAPLKALARLLTESDDLDPKPTAVNLRQDTNGVSRAVAAWGQAHPKQRLLLVIDQFEELITLCQDETEQQHFVTLLLEAVRAHPDQLRLVITLRSDFEPQIRTLLEGMGDVEPLTIGLTDQESGIRDSGTGSNENPESLTSNPESRNWARFIVPPLTQDELREVIEQPARRAALHFEPPELVDKLVNEVIQTPGALPLLSFTLSELYLSYLRRYQARETDERAMIEADYEALGGVAGALSQRATAEYERLGDDSQEITPAQATIRRVMLRMIATEGSELARRPVPHQELIYPDEAENERVRTVLNNLIAARLLITDKTHIEPAHDALVRAWDKLLIWSREAEEVLPLQRRLTQAANDWAAASEEKQKNLLWHNDARLPQVEETLEKGQYDDHPPLVRGLLWLKDYFMPRPVEAVKPYWLNAVEMDFVQQSLNRRRRNRRWTLWTVSIVMGLLAIAAIFANDQRLTAEDRRIAAETAQANEAVAAATAVASEATAVKDREIAEERRVEADRARAEAERQARLNKARELAALSVNKLEEDPEESILLAMAAVTTTYEADGEVTTEAEQALHQAVQASRVRHTLRGHTEEVNDLALSPDGNLLVTAGRDQTTRLWDLTTSHPTQILPPLENITHVSAVAISPNGDWLAVANARGQVQIWNIAENPPQKQMSYSPHTRSILDIAFSPNGQLLATVSEDGASKLLDIGTEAVVKQRRFNSALCGVAFNPAGTHLAIGSDAGVVYLWEVSTNKLSEYTHDDKARAVCAVAFNPVDGSLLATGGSDNTVKLWRLDNDQPLFSLADHTSSIWRLEFSADGERLVSGSFDQTAKLWDVQSGRLLFTFSGHKDWIRAVGISNNGQYLVTASRDKTVKIWVLGSYHQERGTQVTFNPAGSHLATSSLDGTLRLWLPTGQQIAKYNDQAGIVWDTKFYPDGIHLASVSEDGAVRIRDVTTGDLVVGPVKLDERDLFVVDVSPDNTLVAVAGWENVFLLNADTGEKLATIPAHQNQVIALTFHPRMKLLASGGVDGQIKLIDLKRYEIIETLAAPSQQTVEHIAFDPAGHYLAATSLNNWVTVWDVDTGEVSFEISGHDDLVADAAFTSNGDYLITGSVDQTVKIWDVSDVTPGETLTIPRLILPHPTPVDGVAINANDTLLATIGGDGEVRFFPLVLEIDQMLKLAQSRVTARP